MRHEDLEEKIQEKLKQASVSKASVSKQSKLKKGTGEDKQRSVPKSTYASHRAANAKREQKKPGKDTDAYNSEDSLNRTLKT